MTPDVERFAELATRPLAGREALRDEAKTELMSRISHIGAPLDMIDLSEPLERLEKAGPAHPWRRRMGFLAVALTVLIASSLMTGGVVRDLVIAYQAQMGGVGSYLFGHRQSKGEPLIRSWAEAVAPELPLTNGSAVEATKAFRQHPDDVPLLQQTLLKTQFRHFETHREEWLGNVERLDPGNGFHDLLESRRHFAQAIGRMSSSRGSPSGSVTDEKAFRAAVEAFGQAAAAGRFHDASGILKRRQLEAFPEERGLLDQVIQAAFAEFVQSSVSRYGHYYTGLDYRRFVEIRAKRLEVTNDKQGMLQFRDEVLSLARMLVEDSVDGGVSVEGTRHWISTTMNPIGNGLATMGMKDEADRVRKLASELSSMDSSLRGLGWPDQSRSLRLNEWQQVPADLTPEETIPAGRTEMAFIQRLILLSGVLILLLILLFTAIEAYRRSRRIAGMSRGLMPLLDWRDWLWITGLGVILPWAWLLGVRYLTPLGLRDLPPVHEDGIVMVVLLVQSSAALVMAVVMGLWATYWRWEKRGGFLAFRGGALLLGRVCGYLAALAIPLVGLVRYFDYWRMDEEIQIALFLGVCGLAVSGLIWLVWITVLNLCTPQSNALRANVAMRTFLPVMLVLLATLLIGAVVQRSLEQYWCKRDTLFPSRTSTTHVNALEERLERDVRERFLELLDEAS